MTKAPKGSVSVSVIEGRLRLRWSYYDAQGKPNRPSISFGVANSTNRLAAERLARQIELDIASGNYDYSLRKYKAGTDRQDSLLLSQLIDRFISANIAVDQSSSQKRYRTLKNHLLNCFRDLCIDDCDEKKATAFLRYLQDSEISGETVNLYFTNVVKMRNFH